MTDHFSRSFAFDDFGSAISFQDHTVTQSPEVIVFCFRSQTFGVAVFVSTFDRFAFALSPSFLCLRSKLLSLCLDSAQCRDVVVSASTPFAGQTSTTQ